MAYCRFTPDSDVYLYGHVDGGFQCCACRFLPSLESETLETRQAALTHLRKHLIAGHRVPKYALKRLEEEIKECPTT